MIRIAFGYNLSATFSLAYCNGVRPAMNNALLSISSHLQLRIRKVIVPLFWHFKSPTHDLIRKITQLRAVALVITILFYPGFASATTQIDSLFEQFDELAIIQFQDPSTPELAPRTELDCALKFAEARKKIEDMSRLKKPIEKKVSDLNDRYRSILIKMPRVGATKGACTSRMLRDIEGFRSDVADLNLEALKQPVDDTLNCIINFRQNVAEQERLVKANENSSIAASLKLNNRKKDLTDMDTKRNEIAVFLGQIEGFLARRLSEISDSEQINCIEGDVF